MRARGRGRPARISREAILDAALQLGVARLTMRGLARHLGVGASTLYYHFASKEELVARLGDRLVEQLQLQLRDPRDWEVTLRRSAMALRMLFEQAPGSAHTALLDPTWGEPISALHEAACSYLVRAGFTPADGWLVVRTIADFVEAFVVRAEAHGAAGFTDLERAASSKRRRTLRAAHRALSGEEHERRFAYGLDCIVRGIRARRIKRR